MTVNWYNYILGIKSLSKNQLTLHRDALRHGKHKQTESTVSTRQSEQL